MKKISHILGIAAYSLFFILPLSANGDLPTSKDSDSRLDSDNRRLGKNCDSRFNIDNQKQKDADNNQIFVEVNIFVASSEAVDKVLEKYTK